MYNVSVSLANNSLVAIHHVGNMLPSNGALPHLTFSGLRGLGLLTVILFPFLTFINYNNVLTCPI